MRQINLDARNWTDITLFYRDILQAIGAPDWHGTSIDALLDSMVWGGINDLEPPYTVYVHNTSCLSYRIFEEVKNLQQSILEHRREFMKGDGRDVCVSIEML